VVQFDKARACRETNKIKMSDFAMDHNKEERRGK